MTRTVLQTGRHFLLVLAHCALLCKLLIPAGYMPAPLGDGWPIALCPFGLPDGFLAVHASHSGGGHGDAASVSRPGAPDEPHQLVFEHCSLGALSGAIAVPSVVELQIQRPAGERPTSSEVALAIETVALGFQSRAPPRIDSLI